MTTLHFSDAVLTVDENNGCVTSLIVNKQELLAEKSALFRFCLRTLDSTTATVASTEG